MRGFSKTPVIEEESNLSVKKFALAGKRESQESSAGCHSPCCMVRNKAFKDSFSPKFGQGLPPPQNAFWAAFLYSVNRAYYII